MHFKEGDTERGGKTCFGDKVSLCILSWPGPHDIISQAAANSETSSGLFLLSAGIKGMPHHAQ